MAMQECDEQGNVSKGGGYYKKGGKLYKMTDEMRKMMAKANGGEGMASPSGVDAEAKAMVTGGQHESISGGNTSHKDAEMGAQSSPRTSVNKSDIDATVDLLKSYVNANDPATRKDFLLSKASTDELSKSEKDELMEVLGGGVEAAFDTFGAELTKSFGSDSDSLDQAFEVSEFLADYNQEMMKSLSHVADRIEHGERAQGEFNIVLAKSLSQVCELVKSMREELTSITDAPARAPRSRGVNAPAPQPMQKSFGGQEPSGEKLSKAQVLDTIDAMMEKSMAKGDGGVWAGFDLAMESAKVEQTSTVSPGFTEHVRAFRGGSVH